MKMFRLAALLGIVVATSACAEDKAVYVGGNAELDACGTLAQLAPAATTANYFAEPKEGAKSSGSLSAGQMAYVCQEEGEWLGIVVPENEQQECGVSTPIKDKKKYSGPCRSGWIKATQLEIVAG